MRCTARRMISTGLWILPAGMLLIGCGPASPEVAYVEGTVTLDDKPLRGADIVFTPVGQGRPSGARTDEEGWYELKYSQDVVGALPGEHAVEISTFQEGDPGQNLKSSPETIPARYNVKSELTETVEPEANVINFKLTSEGKKMPPPGFGRGG